MHLKRIKARMIYDSRGKPTVEVDAITEDGVFRASVPSGVSSSAMNEALELRDGGSSFGGKGVYTAVYNVNKKIGPELVDKKFDIKDQRSMDDYLIDMDGTENKIRYGVNAIAGVSMAVCKAGAAAKGVPLYSHIADLMGFNSKSLQIPIPVFNFISGGIHSWNHLPMQEILISPKRAENIQEAMKIGTEVYQLMKRRLKEVYGQSAINVGEQGAFTPEMSDAGEALSFLHQVVQKAGFESKVTLGIDANASEFYRHGKYDLQFKRRERVSKHIRLKPYELMMRYKHYVDSYPVDFIEDPFYYEDMESFAFLRRMLPSTCDVYGDNLTLTNAKQIRLAVERKACTGVVIKLNQVGTVKEVLDACRVAHASGLNIMVSHRSAETEDTFIADLAVGVGASRLKAGAPCRTDRLAKYNQIIRISEDL